MGEGQCELSGWEEWEEGSTDKQGQHPGLLLSPPGQCQRPFPWGLALTGETFIRRFPYARQESRCWEAMVSQPERPATPKASGVTQMSPGSR